MAEDSPPSADALTSEERESLAMAEASAREGDWRTAFSHLQRLLASTRGRRDRPAIAFALEEFALFEERAGDAPAAGRARDYARGRFR
jgi:hypothetical protein